MLHRKGNRDIETLSLTQALEGGADSDSDAERRRPKTYNQEQRDVKSAFLEVRWRPIVLPRTLCY